MTKTKEAPVGTPNLSKQEFVSRACTQCARNGTKLTKAEMGHAYDAIMHVARQAVLDMENVTFHGILTLKHSVKPAHKSRNPKTGESVDVPDRLQIKAVINANLKIDAREVNV